MRTSSPNTSDKLHGHDIDDLKEWLILNLEGKTDCDTDQLADFTIKALSVDDSRDAIEEMISEFIEGDVKSFVSSLMDALQSKLYIKSGKKQQRNERQQQQQQQQQHSTNAPLLTTSAPSYAEPSSQNNLPWQDRSRSPNNGHSSSSRGSSSRDRSRHHDRGGYADGSSNNSSSNDWDRSRSGRDRNHRERSQRDGDRNKRRRSPSPLLDAPQHHHHHVMQMQLQQQQQQYGSGAPATTNSYASQNPYDYRSQPSYDDRGDRYHQSKRRREDSPSRGGAGGYRQSRHRYGDRDGDDSGRHHQHYQQQQRYDSQYEHDKSISQDTVTLVGPGAATFHPGRMNDGESFRSAPPRSDNDNHYAQQRMQRHEQQQRDEEANKSTILVSQIPQELNNVDSLMEHFKQFGAVKTIAPKLRVQRAYVQFERYEDAAKAVKSPEAVFGNRFIRVYFAKRQTASDDADVVNVKPTDETGAPAGPTSTSTAAEAAAFDYEQQPYQYPAAPPKQYVVPGTAPGQNMYLNPAVVQQRQQQQQAAAAIDKEQMLLDTRIGLHKILIEKLDRETDAEGKRSILTQVNEMEVKISESMNRIKEFADAPKATAAPTAAAASVQAAEASQDESQQDYQSMQPEEDFNGAAPYGGAPPYHARGRGGFAGRGSWRGMPRGGFAPRGRGGYFPGARVSMINPMTTTRFYTTSTFAVNSIPESKRTRADLEKHFGQFGTIVAMEYRDGADTAVVQLESRASAERSILQGKNMDDSSPALKFSWRQEPIDSQSEQQQQQQQQQDPSAAPTTTSPNAEQHHQHQHQQPAMSQHPQGASRHHEEEVVPVQESNLGSNDYAVEDDMDDIYGYDEDDDDRMRRRE